MHVLNEWQGSLYVDYKWQNVSLEILWLLLGRYNLSLMTFSPSWGCPNVSDFYVIHNSPFHDYFSSEDRTTRLTVTPRFKQYTDYFKGKAYRWNWSWLIAPHKSNFSRTFTAPLFEIIKFTRCPLPQNTAVAGSRMLLQPVRSRVEGTQGPIVNSGRFWYI